MHVWAASQNVYNALECIYIHFVSLLFLSLYFHLFKQFIGLSDPRLQEQEDYQQHTLTCYVSASAS